MDELLTIPMTGHVQSLNASVAAGLLMYQAFPNVRGVDHEKQLLIVDGYNMIGSWPELVQLKSRTKWRMQEKLFTSFIKLCEI